MRSLPKPKHAAAAARARGCAGSCGPWEMRERSGPRPLATGPPHPHIHLHILNLNPDPIQISCTLGTPCPWSAAPVAGGRVADAPCTLTPALSLEPIEHILQHWTHVCLNAPPHLNSIPALEPGLRIHTNKHYTTIGPSYATPPSNRSAHGGGRAADACGLDPGTSYAPLTLVPWP